MNLSFNSTIPVLTIGDIIIEGWQINNMPPNYSNQNAIVFSNDVDDCYIEKNLFEIIKDYSVKEFPDTRIEIVIDPVTIDNEPDILKSIPYPFKGLKIKISQDRFIICFDLIQEFRHLDEEWNKKWTNEFYFDNFAKIIENEEDLTIYYDKEKFLMLEIAIMTTSETLEIAVKEAIKKIREIIDKVEYSINGLYGFFEAIEIWKNKSVINSEAFWHKFLKKYSWLLSLIINEPTIILEDEAYVGGKSINNKGSNIADFIYQNKLSGNIALIEIKTPQTNILGKKYRNTFTLSSELTGAINQILNYIDNFQKNYYNLVHNSNLKFNVIAPSAYLIIGNQENMTIKEKECFELYRKHLNNIKIISFDELFEKAFFILSMIQK